MLLKTTEQFRLMTIPITSTVNIQAQHEGGEWKRAVEAKRQKKEEDHRVMRREEGGERNITPQMM